VEITVSGKAPTQGPAYHGPPRPVRNVQREKQDALRRPQAAILFRALRAAGEAGLSWKECWALAPDDEEFVVGPIVFWLRFHGCTSMPGTTRSLGRPGSISSSDIALGSRSRVADSYTHT